MTSGVKRCSFDKAQSSRGLSEGPLETGCASQTCNFDCQQCRPADSERSESSDQPVTLSLAQASSAPCFRRMSPVARLQTLHLPQTTSHSPSC
jgi:hypothetical protein